MVMASSRNSFRVGVLVFVFAFAVWQGAMMIPTVPA
jgi:hypothetical protein